MILKLTRNNRFMKFELQRVHFMPKELQPGVLYVSEEFGTAAHLCASGCGSKIRTPLGPSEWTLEIEDGKPSLRPSIGNWQLPCKSHYWITQGQVDWSTRWSDELIKQGRRAEASRRQLHYSSPHDARKGYSLRLWSCIKSLFGF